MLQSRKESLSRPRILILTSRTGGGHLSLALALQDILKNTYETVIVDPQPPLFQFYYRLVTRYLLKAWDLNYRTSDNEKTALRSHQFYYFFNRRRISSLLESIQPKLVISTYVLTTYEVARVLRDRDQNTPLAILFADPERVHQAWLTEKGADAYLAPTREISFQAYESGISKERLHLVGWPTRYQFYQTDPSARARGLQELDLDPNTFTVFLQGGGDGAAGFDKMLRSLLNHNMPIQIILAAGNNKSLAARYKGVSNLRVLDFTRDIARYMNLGDIIAGKAGPNILFESVALEKPFLATTFIPGQEELNLRFIKRHDLGWVCLNPSEEISLLESILLDPSLIQNKIRSVRLYKEWNLQANQGIRRVVDGLMQQDGGLPSVALFDKPISTQFGEQ